MTGAAWLGAWMLGATVARSRPGPEISRDRGRPNGVVVLWPRVVPESEAPWVRDLARELQASAARIAREVVGKRRVEARPEPERVCPREGCRAVSVSMLLAHRGSGCALALVVGAPERGNGQLIPLHGAWLLESSELGFREPPERAAVVEDFAPCATVVPTLTPERLAPAIERALKTEAHP